MTQTQNMLPSPGFNIHPWIPWPRTCGHVHPTSPNKGHLPRLTRIPGTLERPDSDHHRRKWHRLYTQSAGSGTRALDILKRLEEIVDVRMFHKIEIGSVLADELTMLATMYSFPLCTGMIYPEYVSGGIWSTEGKIAAARRGPGSLVKCG